MSTTHNHFFAGHYANNATGSKPLSVHVDANVPAFSHLSGDEGRHFFDWGVACLRSRHLELLVEWTLVWFAYTSFSISWTVANPMAVMSKGMARLWAKRAWRWFGKHRFVSFWKTRCILRQAHVWILCHTPMNCILQAASLAADSYTFIFGWQHSKYRSPTVLSPCTAKQNWSSTFLTYDTCINGHTKRMRTPMLMLF